MRSQAPQSSRKTSAQEANQRCANSDAKGRSPCKQPVYNNLNTARPRNVGSASAQREFPVNVEWAHFAHVLRQNARYFGECFGMPG